MMHPAQPQPAQPAQPAAQLYRHVAAPSPLGMATQAVPSPLVVRVPVVPWYHLDPSGSIWIHLDPSGSLNIAMENNH